MLSLFSSMMMKFLKFLRSREKPHATPTPRFSNNRDLRILGPRLANDEKHYLTFSLDVRYLNREERLPLGLLLLIVNIFTYHPLTVSSKKQSVCQTQHIIEMLLKKATRQQKLSGEETIRQLCKGSWKDYRTLKSSKLFEKTQLDNF